MKKHKFMILSEDTGWIQDELTSENLKRLRIVDCEHIHVVSGNFENFSDNVVEVDGQDLFRDVNGGLHYYTDHLTKNEIITLFE